MASDGLPASKQAAKKALAALLSLSVVSLKGLIITDKSIAGH
jgi:hypothetical protein